MSDSGGGIVDSFTETTTKSWGSRIGESIKGVLFGLLFTIGSCVLLFWNEGRAVQTEKSLAEGRGLVVSADAARVDPANEGKLVHVNGEVKAGVTLRDAEFNVTANALRLVRTVEMYQWKEDSKSETRKTLGGGEETTTTYSYHLVWEDHRIDSSQFKRRDGHENPQMRYQRVASTARDATLGAYRPGAPVLSQLPASQELPVDPALAAALSGKVAGPVQVTDGKLYLGANPEEPKPGDLRVTFRTVPNGPASIIGEQSGTDFAEYQTKAGDRLLMARSGTMSAAGMFKDAQDEAVDTARKNFAANLDPRAKDQPSIALPTTAPQDAAERVDVELLLRGHVRRVEVMVPVDDRAFTGDENLRVRRNRRRNGERDGKSANRGLHACLLERGSLH